MVGKTIVVDADAVAGTGADADAGGEISPYRFEAGAPRCATALAQP